MTDQEPNITAPTNMGEVNITLSYIRRDITEISKKLDTMASGNVTRVDFEEHLKADADHEARIRNLESFKETLIGKMWGVGILVSAGTTIVTIAINYFLK
jgi:hypothetical protein